MNRCPSGLYFDDISKFCTFKNEARCGPVPTSKYNRNILFVLKQRMYSSCANNWATDRLGGKMQPSRMPATLLFLLERWHHNTRKFRTRKRKTLIQFYSCVNQYNFQTPQMVLLTFDGAINLQNYDHYKKVLNGKRTNPNGCPIRGTFYVSHEYSNYQMIQQLASEGHELGTETIS